jgi:hypothetical protein
MPHSITILSLIVSLLGPVTTLCQSDSADVFPLTVGNTWVFSHRSHAWQMDGGPGSDTLGITDSGSVSCRIVARLDYPDSTRWQVEQRRVLSRRRGTQHSDTTFAVVDTQMFSLTESRSGPHRLNCDQWGMWDLPALPFMSGFPDSAAVRRFASVDSLGLFRLHTSALDGGGTGLVFEFTFAENIGQTAARCSLINSTGVEYQSSFLLSSFALLSAPSPDPNIPFGCVLEQNWPNPFNGSTHIGFDIPSSQFVVLRLCNLLGQNIATLLEEQLPPGHRVVTLNAANLPSGPYVYWLKTENAILTKKLLLLR